MKKHLFLILLFAGLALGVQAQDLTVSGTTRGAVQVQPQVTADQWPFAGFTQTLKASFVWEDWLFLGSLEASADLSNLTSESADPTWRSAGPLAGTYRWDPASNGVALIKELYAEYAPGDFLLRAGQQVFTWGLADGNNPTDTLNPRWVGTRFTTSLDDQKIPVPGLLAEYTLPDNLGKIEGVFLPWAVPNLLPSVAFDQMVFSGNVMASIPGQRIIFKDPEVPDLALDNFEGGLRGLFYLDNLTFSVSYLTQLDKYFDLEVTNTFVPGTPMVTPDMNITTQTPVFSRVHQFGADFATTGFGWELRGEGAFVLTPDRDGNQIYIKNPSVKGVLQLSRSWFDGVFSSSLSWAPTWVINHTWWEDYTSDQGLQQAAYQMAQRNGQAYEWENALGLRLAFTLLNETLKPDLLMLYNLAAQDSLATLGVTYNLADGWNLKVVANLYTPFQKDKENKELGIFGNSVSDKKDGVYLELRWDW